MKFNRFFRGVGVIAGVLCAGALMCREARALEPDEILLITNKNSPDSGKLAAMYSQLRNIPSDQTIALDLPTDEEMSFDTYETGVVGPVREFLSDHQLRGKVKCLLTFYGVPFRIHARVNSAAEDQELANLQKLQTDVTGQINQTALRLEGNAAALDPSFKPGVGDSVTVMLARARAAMGAISEKLASLPSADQVKQKNQIIIAIETLDGIADIDARIGQQQIDDPTKTDAERKYLVDRHRYVQDARTQLQQLQGMRWDADARARLVKTARGIFGLVGTMRVAEAEINYLTPDATSGAATDNELALLWMDYYPRQRWIANPLNYTSVHAAPEAMMVMRLDGPDPATVQKMMQTSVDVEKAGLKGTIALDARGLSPVDAKGNPDAYGEFDETIRNLAYLVRTKTDLKIRLDDQDIVFPPHSVKDVALYCGWYSVNRYIPGCDFNAGAVGFHIASFEMVTLHENSTYWVRGLLKDGVVGTLGPVAEPYLSAFPRPDEFFPLLLTGKLTLAEVYWKTTPMASWMISFIGDPLYTPYKTDPAIKVEDLPPRLRRAVDGLPFEGPSGTTDSSRHEN